MTAGVRVRDRTTHEIIFDSSEEIVLFPIDSRIIAGSAVGAGSVYDYPQQAGRKIVANMYSPYQTGDIDGCSVQSCRVSYVAGVPRVTVFVDNDTSGLPVADGYLVVFTSGVPQ